MTNAVEQLGTEIVTNVIKEVEGDVTAARNFATEQVKALAAQAVSIATMAAQPYGSDNGFADKAQMDQFLVMLKETAKNFVNALIGLAKIALEKAWNAVVETLWGAINRAASAALGVALPVPGVPSDM